MSDRSDTTAREERIRARAHQLWQAAGEPEGRDAEFWHKAEAEIESERLTEDDPGKSDEDAG